MLYNMLANFGHGSTHVRIRVKQVVMLLRLPIRESGQLLRDRLEQTDNHADRSGLHVSAEFIHSSRILRSHQSSIMQNTKYLFELTGVR